MFSPARRLLTVGIALIAGLRSHGAVPVPAGDPLRAPTAPRPSRTRQLSSPDRVQATHGSTWRERWNAFRRRWAPAGGNVRECARRREQIRKGMLGGCNDVRWSEGTLALQATIQTTHADRSFIAVDRGSPNGDVTAIARAHCEPGGRVVIDDIFEFQPAGRDPSP